MINKLIFLFLLFSIVEASANIKEKIIQNLKTATQDKTLIVVTHRSSLLSLVDRIIVLDNGKIVADGPKQKVIAALNNQTVEQAS